MTTYFFFIYLFFYYFLFFNFEQSGTLVMWPSRDQVMWPSRVAYPGTAFLIVVFLSTRNAWAIILCNPWGLQAECDKGQLTSWRSVSKNNQIYFCAIRKASYSTPTKVPGLFFHFIAEGFRKISETKNRSGAQFHVVMMWVTSFFGVAFEDSV